MERPTYIASCSFGKDSIATILLAMLHNEPLDRIVSVEVMFDNARGISGEDPEHIQWVKEFAIPRLKELTGIDTDLIRNEKDDYLTEFFKKRGTVVAGGSVVAGIGGSLAKTLFPMSELQLMSRNGWSD